MESLRRTTTQVLDFVRAHVKDNLSNILYQFSYLLHKIYSTSAWQYSTKTSMLWTFSEVTREEGLRNKSQPTKQDVDPAGQDKG